MNINGSTVLFALQNLKYSKTPCAKSISEFAILWGPLMFVFVNLSPGYSDGTKLEFQ
jgi:hypothetical protein